MLKKIYDLTQKESQDICIARRKQYVENKKQCCQECPLRYKDNCTECWQFVNGSAMRNLYNHIGNNLVEIVEKVAEDE